MAGGGEVPSLSGSPSLLPEYLRCEYKTNPIGIDAATPRLSWYDASTVRGDYQSHYEILVASTPKLLAPGKADIWDTGQVTSGQTMATFAGTPIASRERVWWKVLVWGAHGGSPTSSKPAFFERGLAQADDWQASWISLPELSRPRPAQYLRRAFDVGPGLVSARAYVAVKGLYHFYVDGARVDDAELLPGWTDYHKRIQYQTYDLTKLLKVHGKRHVGGIVLGDGWYCGHVGWTPGDNYGTEPAALIQLELRYANGTDKIVTDGSWQGQTGPILSDDLLMGEEFDARKKLDPAIPNGWSSVHSTSKGWTAVKTEPIGDALLVASASPPVRVYTEIHPKSVEEPTPGHFVFDLGQNMVGWARLRVQGAPGTKIQLRFAEMLNPDRSVYTTNLRGAKATDTYTIGSTAPEVYEPSFTFHGFRYVELTGYPGTPDASAITGVVITSDNPRTGEFLCSNALVNQLQHNILWGERGNYVSVPTDCPQRDERLGWMGDAQIFVKTAAYNNDIDGFMTKWTQDVVDAQSKEGGFSDVSPRKGDDSDGAPAWGDAGVIVPYTIYRMYGDRSILAERYEAMQHWIEYIDSVNPDHLWVNHSNNNFGDWLNVQDDTPRPVLGTAYFAYDTQIMTEVAQALGKSDDAAHYANLHNEIVEAFQKNYVSEDGKIDGDSQTAYVIGLRFNLLPEALRAKAAQRLVDHILIDRKGHLSTGFVGVGYLNPTLTEIGRPDVAYKLLLNDTYPSWGYSIRQGATTIWERWDGYTKEKGFQDPGMNSFNHYSMGSVGEWLYSSVAGIQPLSPGFDKFRVAPVPGGGLSWVHCSYETPHGKIVSNWKRDKEAFHLEVAVPVNSVAELALPCSDPTGTDIQESGHNPIKDPVPGITYLRMDGDRAVFALQSGKYTFSSGWHG